ncbi:hypothetical protein BC830DRAFT_312397 [Chytriomyces sp. MP71]|nr:hypothetical protein BC830DRAFT_312397 [Chytriomyces sp. MP71]
MSLKTTTALGTSFERLSLATLESLGFSHLTRVGGRGDGGIDLRGTLLLAPTTSAINTLVQCKHEQTKLGPRVLRELDGVLARQSFVSSGHSRPLGVLCAAQQGFSTACIAAARASRAPLLLLRIHVDLNLDSEKVALEGPENTDVSLLLNHAAMRAWEGLSAGMVHSRTFCKPNAGMFETRSTACLMFRERNNLLN